MSPQDFIERVRTLFQVFFPIIPNFANIKVLNFHVKIPKFLFHFWLGDTSMPDHYKKNQQKWLAILPSGWEYKLYTDSDIYSFEFSSTESRTVYNSLPNNTAKSDLIRMELLNKYGGLYVDLDTEPYELLDFLVYSFDFFGLLFGPQAGDLFI